MSQKEVRVRIAPSPTGDPHVGTAYVALFNYAFARRHGGKFILRIEDTDRARSTTASEEAIIRALRWLGLDWDEGPDKGGPHGPYRQSERGTIYREHAEMLIERGHAYRCFCTPERLAELRGEQQKAKASKMGYDGKCRSLSPEEADERGRGGESFTVRLKMPQEGETVLLDGLRGEIRIPNEQSDDQVLLKSDGMPTYHLANVVDDHLMGISHVIRAEEWISSAPKHLRLYEAFGWEPATFLHLPLLRNNDKNKSKISKRRNPVSLDYYRDTGIIPEAMVNFLALMGWSYGEDQEKFSLEQMVERFDLKEGSVSLSGPVFDLDKLSWLNGLYMRELSDEGLVDALMGWRVNRDYLLRLAPLVRDRIQRFDEFLPLISYCFSGDIDYTPVAALLLPKKRKGGETGKMLERLLDKLDAMPAFEVSAMEETFRLFCEGEEWSTREVFMTVRVGLTGRKASPGLFETMEVIGRELTRRRLRLAANFLKQYKG
ncbi:MAG: glutamate--tRNA ligase [Deltaproteobacteria bacterium]|nr:glutamate--tRNA ligase [Deltaproteobacteria bacterium]